MEVNQFILRDAALGLFMRNGNVADITISSVASEAGCDTQDVYQHFANRDALVAGLQANLFSGLLDGLQAAFGSPHGDAQQRLYRLMDVYVRHARENPAGYQLMFDTPLSSGSACIPLAEMRVALMELGVGAWQAAADAGYAVDDARTAMHLTWATLHGLLQLEANEQLNLGRDFDTLLTAVLGSIIGPRPQTQLAVV